MTARRNTIRAALIATAAMLAACKANDAQPTTSAAGAPATQAAETDGQPWSLAAPITRSKDGVSVSFDRVRNTGRAHLFGTASAPGLAHGAYAFAENAIDGRVIRASLTDNGSDTWVGPNSVWGAPLTRALRTKPANPVNTRRDSLGERVATAAWTRDGVECGVVRVMAGMRPGSGGRDYTDGAAAAGCGVAGTSRADLLRTLENATRAGLAALDAGVEAVRKGPTQTAAAGLRTGA